MKVISQVTSYIGILNEWQKWMNCMVRLSWDIGPFFLNKLPTFKVQNFTQQFILFPKKTQVWDDYGYGVGNAYTRTRTHTDGGPSMQPNLDLQVSQGGPTLLAKVQGMT